LLQEVLINSREDEYYDEDNAKFVPNNENESGAQYASHTLVNEAIQEN
jgi:hypothetical protein